MLIGIRTEDATVSCFGAKDCAATGAFVGDQSHVGRHLLFFGKSALRTGEDGFQLYHDLNFLRP